MRERILATLTTILERIADAFALDEEGWQQHANPMSGWTRVPVLPVMALAIWSRDWIGWWCVVPIALIIVWAYVNPRAFPRPASTTAWVSRAVMGERVLLNREQIPIPSHHSLWAALLSALAVLGLPPLIWGLWALSLPWVLLGLVICVGAKLWFLDRMVWLFDEMSATVPAYADWRR